MKTPNRKFNQERLHSKLGQAPDFKQQKRTPNTFSRKGKDKLLLQLTTNK